ncbi:MAG: hypothetical protein PWR01_4295 [Clostridiales bacterium]|nr:hypothetical protein [Clostridiales bacterium]MDN5283222.1 hypothetical protein [Candidatus Ozemobacter sp.]
MKAKLAKVLNFILPCQLSLKPEIACLSRSLSLSRRAGLAENRSFHLATPITGCHALRPSSAREKLNDRLGTPITGSHALRPSSARARQITDSMTAPPLAEAIFMSLGELVEASRPGKMRRKNS